MVPYVYDCTARKLYHSHSNLGDAPKTLGLMKSYYVSPMSHVSLVRYSMVFLPATCGAPLGALAAPRPPAPQRPARRPPRRGGRKGASVAALSKLG